jgi:LuxR family maltose regulon positive regulatory protein
MRTGQRILKTKWIPPLPSPRTFRRPELAKKLKGWVQSPLTLVHAGPGYGKTAAVACFFQDEQLTPGWYRIGEGDAKPAVFFRYLLSALNARFPSIGETWRHRLERGEEDPEADEWFDLGSDLLNELVLLEERAVFVLDNWHLAEEEPFLARWMEWFVSHLPEGFHLVLISRTRPHWPRLAEMRVKGNVLELTGDDLSFSEEEAAVWLADEYGIALSPDDSKRLHAQTGGWVLALRLIGEKFARFRRMEEQFAEEIGAELFPFLDAAVWEKQPHDVRRFFMQTALLDAWSLEDLEASYPEADARQIQEHLLRQHLFLRRTEEGAFCYLPLFRNYLRQKLEQRPEERLSFYRFAAEHYCRNRRFDEAVRLMLETKDAESISRFLEEHGPAMLDQGRLDPIETALSELPEEVKDRRYSLWVLEGEVNRYRCSYARAMDCYARGERLAEDRGDVRGVSMALEGQARIFLDTIQPQEAERLLNRALDVLEGVAGAEKQRRRLTRLIAENLVNYGRGDDAGEWVAKSREPPDGEEELEARYYLRTGQLVQAKQILERKKRVETGRERLRLPRSHRETDVLLSLIHAMMGEPERAKQFAEAGIMQGVRWQVPFVEACGWMRMGHAVQLLNRYETQLSADCYRTSLDLMEELKVSRGKAEPLMGLCLLYGREGSVESALACGEEALTETERAKDFWLSTLIRLAMGIACAHASRWKEADGWFAQCSRDFARCGDSYGLTVTSLWQALAAFKLKEQDRFSTCMERFLNWMRTGEHEYLLRRRTLFGPSDVQWVTRLLFEAQRQGVKEAYVSHLLADLGFERITFHPGYTLRVETLGGFRVWLGDEPVEEKGWQRWKAKELLQLFITRRQHLLPKEEILSLLWPGVEKSAASRDFKVALHALNQVLEPGRPARSTPFFIQRQGSMYGLNPASGFELDAAEFERRILEGLQSRNPDRARNVLAAGLSLYKGEYLPERRYDDWCREERERLDTLFLRGAERLAQLLLDAGDDDGVIYWSERILRQDSCWEEAYRLLMIAYFRKNNRPQSIKWYRRCRQTLERELDIAPMPETERLYRMIREGDLGDETPVDGPARGVGGGDPDPFVS